MVGRLRAAWRGLRSRYWAALVFDVLFIAGAFLLVHAWQTRDLPVDEPAPKTYLALLDGSGFQTAVSKGGAGVVYFFAPWCFYCKSSIGNLDDLVADGTVSWATAVALDYTDAAEVRAFAERTAISMPILMGNAQTAADWSVRAFPTYYVIDAEGRISSRSVGYATALGLRVRNRLAR